MKEKLTAKQLRFVQEYVVLGDATKAAIAAGYAPKWASEQAYQLIHKTTVAAAIAEKQQALAKKADLSAEWVLGEMKATYERATQAEDYGPANKALENIGRHLGMFPKDGTTVNIDNRTQTIAMTPDELRQALDEVRALRGQR